MIQTAGTWQAESAPLMFLAGNIKLLAQAARQYSSILVAVNEITSKQTERYLEQIAAAGASLLIDSGIYSLAMDHAREHGVSHDEALSLQPEQVDGFDALETQYRRVVRRYKDNVWGYIELDLGGPETKTRTRERLEASGLRPIPVFHPLTDGWDYFHKLASQYDRICCGNLVAASPNVRVNILAKLSSLVRQYPTVWIHLLGVGPSPTLAAFPFSSADSSSWLRHVRWAPMVSVRTAMVNFSRLSHRYWYKKGDSDSESKAIDMCAYDSVFDQINWRLMTEWPQSEFPVLVQ